jgi:hypothetical protein
MSLSRRTLLRIAAPAALAAATCPAPARAQRLRILEPAPTGPHPPGTARLPELEHALQGLRIGPPSRHGALLVFWLLGPEPAAPLDIATLDEARAAGTLVIAERDRATVPELVVDNRGPAHVLLLAGEILVGGKQNRVLREDLLLPPLSGPRAIGVYCVEQGRWSDGRRDFESRASFAQPGLRKQVLDRADQGRVWAEVEQARRAAAAPPSPTQSYQHVYEQPGVRERLAEAERALDAKAAPRAVGAAVFAGPAFSGLDLFRSAGLFARQWPKLLRAHALEAPAPPRIAPAPDGTGRAQVERLLAVAARARGTVRGNAGVGQLFEFSADGQRGAGLAYEGTVIHAAIL